MTKTKVDFVMNMQSAALKEIGDAAPSHTAKDIYDMLRANKYSALARDWVTDLGPFACLLYGCRKCRRHPARSNSWLKAIRNKVELAPGLTDTGDDKGFWLCAACLDKWCWATGGTERLFVVGSKQSIAVGEYFYMMIGDETASEHENTFNYIKSCTTLTELHGTTVTTAALLKVISDMNDRIEQRLSKGVREMVTVRSLGLDECPYDDWKGWMEHVRLYCENDVLSMAVTGTHFKAIDLNMCREPVGRFTSSGLSSFLDVLAGCLNVDSTVPVEPALRRTRWTLMESRGFKEARGRLLAIAGHVIAPERCLSGACAAEELEEV